MVEVFQSYETDEIIELRDDLRSKNIHYDVKFIDELLYIIFIY